MRGSYSCVGIANPLIKRRIENNRRMNETLEEMARAIFKSWFVDFDPVHAKAALKNHSPLEGESANQGQSPQMRRWGDIKRQYTTKAQHPSDQKEGDISLSNPGVRDWTVARAKRYLATMDAATAALKNHSPLEGESANQGQSPQMRRWGDIKRQYTTKAQHPSDQKEGDISLSNPGVRDWTVARAKRYLATMDAATAALKNHSPLEVESANQGQSPQMRRWGDIKRQYTTKAQHPSDQKEGDISLSNPGVRDWTVARAKRYLATMDAATAALKNHSPLEGESANQGQSPQMRRWGDIKRQYTTKAQHPSDQKEGDISLSNPGVRDWTVARAKRYLATMDAATAALKNHSPLEGESANQGQSPQMRRWGDIKRQYTTKAQHPSDQKEGDISLSNPGVRDWTAAHAKRYLATMDATTAALFPSAFGDDGLPVGWIRKALKDFTIELESGKRPKGGIDKSLSEGVPSIGAESLLKIGEFEYSKLKFVKKEFAEESSKGWVQNYDVAIYKDGANVGDPTRVSLFGNGFPFDRFMVNEHVFLIRSKAMGQPFLYYLFQSVMLLQQLHSMGTSKAAQPGLNQQEVLSCEFIAPNEELFEVFNRTIIPLVDRRLAIGQENQTLAELRDTLLPKLMSGEVRVKNTINELEGIV